MYNIIMFIFISIGNSCIYQLYMCTIMLIKMKFIKATSEKKIIGCFQIKYLCFVFISIIYKHTEPDFWWKNKHNTSFNLCFELNFFLRI